MSNEWAQIRWQNLGKIMLDKSQQDKKKATDICLVKTASPTFQVLRPDGLYACKYGMRGRKIEI